MSTVKSERTNLETHVDLCELRYQQLDDRMNRVEQRIDHITEELREVRTSMQTGFTEVKDMINREHADRFRTMVTTTGTIIVGLLGLLGYIVVNLK